MSDLVEFLMARIAEDEAAATSALTRDHWEYQGYGDFGPYVSADCEAKRQIVEDFNVLMRDYRATRDPVTEARRFQAAIAMGRLATTYRGHADYNEDWRP